MSEVRRPQPGVKESFQPSERGPGPAVPTVHFLGARRRVDDAPADRLCCGRKPSTRLRTTRRMAEVTCRTCLRYLPYPGFPDMFENDRDLLDAILAVDPEPLSRDKYAAQIGKPIRSVGLFAMRLVRANVIDREVVDRQTHFYRLVPDKERLRRADEAMARLEGRMPCWEDEDVP